MVRQKQVVVSYCIASWEYFLSNSWYSYEIAALIRDETSVFHIFRQFHNTILSSIRRGSVESFTLVPLWKWVRIFKNGNTRFHRMRGRHSRININIFIGRIYKNCKCFKWIEMQKTLAHFWTLKGNWSDLFP